MSEEEAQARMNEFDREPLFNNDEPNVHTDPSHLLEAGSAPSPYKPTTTQPAPAPTAVQSEPTDELPTMGPGLLVLQWLVYAFWGWTIFVLSLLTLSVINQMLDSSGGNDYTYGSYDSGVAYALAATIVLFLISLGCDIFFARAEKKHARSTGSNVIMLVHTVIFALLGTSALIAAVFGAVSLLIGDGGEAKEVTAAMITGFVAFGLYGLLLLRTLQPRWAKKFTALFWVIIGIVVIAMVILGIIGPVTVARLQAKDKIIENGLPEIAREINQYVSVKDKLPLTLGELDDLNNEDATRIIDEGLVQYKPGKQLNALGLSGLKSESLRKEFARTAPIYLYQLCVTFNSGDEGPAYEDDYPSNGGVRGGSSSQYKTSISTYGHKAGRVCYDVQSGYNYDYTIDSGAEDSEPSTGSN